MEAAQVYEGAPCPRCGAGTVVRRHAADSFALPECWWWACDSCDWATEPE